MARMGPLQHVMHFHLPMSLFVIMASNAYVYFLQLRERERKASELARSLAEARLSALQMQLHPHFLFNALNATMALIRRDPSGAEEMIANLSELLRLTLSTRDQHEITLAQELEYLECYRDIQMPKRDGFGVVKALEGGRMPVIISTTAFDQHALAAFEAHAVDYVLKPFRAARLHQAIERARELLAGRGSQEAVNRLLKLIAERESDDTPRLTRIPIRLEGRTVFVKTEEVDWIEAAGNYMVVHAGSDNHILRETMAALEQQLPPSICLFSRCPSAKPRLLRREPGVHAG